MKKIDIGLSIAVHVGYGRYQIWRCDVFQCEGCGSEVYGDFGDKPVTTTKKLSDWRLDGVID
ncbi:MAG: hypothetical protein ACOC4M_08185 [Promethearchaeia archaeon]